MAISDALKDAGDGIKSAVGLGHSDDAPSGREYSHILSSANTLTIAAASHKQMSDARLPLAYRDSCAHLLIPLNKCRRDEYYLPWKCEVRRAVSSTTTSPNTFVSRTSDIRTRNASMKSSRNGWRRWRSLKRKQKMVQE